MSRENNPNPTVATPPSPTPETAPVRGAKRNRRWEMSHPVLRYWVPVHVREEAQKVRAAIRGLAESLSEKGEEEFSAATGEVARVFLEFSWKDMERGNLAFAPRPNPQGRKMRLTWVEVEEDQRRPQEIPQNIGEKRGKGDMWLGYRMLPDEVRLWQSRIQRLAAQHSLAPGEVLVGLLAHGLEAYKAGRLVFRKTPVVTKWQVTGRISRKAGR